jgi:citrate synthase
MSEDTEGAKARIGEWWQSGITDFEPGKIWLRGYPVEQLIGRTGFAATTWLMVRGELPSAGEAKLFEAALVSAVDHGPQAPSTAIARMAVSCGAGLNGAMASAVNVLDHVHGGAGEQAMELFADVVARIDAGAAPDDAAIAACASWREKRGAFIPGFGHRFHKIDPRAPRLLELVDEAQAAGTVPGRIKAAARGIESALAAEKGKAIGMNVDGATAVVYGELGFAAPLARGLFVLSRSVGALAHAWEEQCQGTRIKSPMPPEMHHLYTGPPPRDLPPEG